MIISETHFVVRYAETDQMGIVHHSNYPIWYEAGRTDFMKKLGFPYSRIEEMGILIPLIELKCSYIGAAKYEDEITVKTSIKSITGARMVCSYEVYKKGQYAAINTGETMHAWTTKELRPVNLKKHVPELYELMSKAVAIK